jgi:hypothetical protein
VSLPLVNTTPPAAPPTLASIAEMLASMQLQMTAMNNHLADQGARLSALDGRPTFPQFGLPGFGGVPRLPASLSPVITEVAAGTEDSSASASVAPAWPLSLPAPPPPQQPAAAPQGSQQAPTPLPGGLLIT